jgi:aspartyl-tRNA(Asn)/glutamyl-tRNA(Gln) amidotransferase subunit C
MRKFRNQLKQRLASPEARPTTKMAYHNAFRSEAGLVPCFARHLLMSLSPEEIDRIARLARLELSPDEIGYTRNQLNDILAFIEQLQSVNTTGIAPMAHAVDIVQRLRSDTVTETDCRDTFQAIAPDTEAGLYLVPKVIE